jgi:hypothetical protein
MELSQQYITREHRFMPVHMWCDIKVPRLHSYFRQITLHRDVASMDMLQGET